MAESVVGMRLLGSHEVGVVPRDLLPRVRASERERLTAVVVVNAVPALKHLEPAGKVPDRDGGPDARVIVRSRPGEEQRTRIVIVRVGLDHLGADGGVELADVNLDPVPGLRLDADVSLLEVAEAFGRALRAAVPVEGLAEADVEAEPDRGRSPLHGHLTQADVVA